MISDYELKQINANIEKIRFDLIFLDPSNPFEEGTISRYESCLKEYILKLEYSINKCKTKQSHLRLV